MTRRHHLLMGSGLLALVVVIYGRHILHAEFVYEDGVWLVSPGTPSLGPRVLAELAWWLWPSPQAMHALSVVLFVAVGALVGLLATRLGLSALASWGARALFLTAPVLVESAAYAASLPELIAAIGLLAACLFSTLQTRWRWPLVALAMLFGVGGKETALLTVGLVPLTLWVCGIWPLRRLVFFGAAGVALGVLTVDVPALVNWGESGDLSIPGRDWVFTQGAAVYRLVGVSLSGTGMAIDPDLDILAPAVKGFALAAVGLTGLIALTLTQTRPILAFGLLWCLLSAAPRFLVQTPRSYFNEHQWLVPFIGLLIAGVSLWDNWQLRTA